MRVLLTCACLLLTSCAVVVGTYVPSETSAAVTLPEGTLFKTPTGGAYRLGDAAVIMPANQWRHVLSIMARLSTNQPDPPQGGGEDM